MDNNGRRNGNLTVMDDEWQLDGEGRCDDDLMVMDDEERREYDGDVGAAGGGSDKGQHGIKT